MFRILAALMVLSVLAPPAMAQTPVPERRLVVTRDVDFYGADLQALFDTTLEACQAVCLNNPDCRAFTFNGRSNACFPKSDLSDRQPYEGATSARVLITDPDVLARAPARAAELDFLGQADLSQATAQAEGIAVRHGGGEWDLDALLSSARAQVDRGNIAGAIHWTGAAVAQSDRPDLWLEYARLSRQHSAALTARNDKQRFARRALRAAVNGYLRAPGPAVQISALVELARALEINGRGRDMIPALRLAESLGSRSDVSDLLEDALGKYGFRIVEHTVDADSADPRVCAEFSDPLVQVGTDYAPFVRLPDARLAVEASGVQLCISGIDHGSRYTVTFREGLPAASGEALLRDVELVFYVRDRSPSVRFPGRAYVLPKTADAGLPIETVNLTSVDLVLRRVSDRNLTRAFQDSYFGRPLAQYELERFSTEIAEEIWRGTGDVGMELNADILTRLPMGDVVGGLEAGIYALTASVPGADPYDDPGATQWFVLSDIGITTMSGTDGLHVFARRLTDAAPMTGLEVTLVSRANRVLGTAVTDALGHAVFDPGLTRGRGAAQAALVTARDGDRDLAFLSLTDPAFDLSDRGVAGREPGGPVDVFLTTDRGAYRTGETIHATVLARDAQVAGIAGLPLTAVLTRPDGVEVRREVSVDDRAGGHVFSLPLAPSVPRGTWRLAIYADADAPALASQTLLVEDFVPERIDIDLDLPEGPIAPTAPPLLDVAVRYLFGAPGADMPIEGELRLRPKTTLEGFPGVQFGRHDAQAQAVTRVLAEGLRTDAEGRARIALPLPPQELTDRPHDAEVVLRVTEGSGRPVERTISRPVAPEGPVIGIRPAFDGVVPEGTEAGFSLIALGPDLEPMEMPVRWTLNRVSTRYQWYQLYGRWNWEPVTTRKRVASGDATLGDATATISAPVDWGRYELVVEREGGTYVSASVGFSAGWYAPADASATPDTLEVSLDRDAYAVGDTARLRIVPRHAGKALVTVMADRVIAMQAVEVGTGETLVDLPVTEEWGAGVYVTAQLVRPMDTATGQAPARALGLAHAAIDAGARQLQVELRAPDKIAPRGSLEVQVAVDGLAEGDNAWITLAAVDLGILNLTGFDSPDPSAHYFGQRRLGVEIRDIYGRLIDGANGAMGQIRSGGDSGSEMRLQSPPPTEDLVTFFSGPVQVDADGMARASFDVPDFNGTLRLMAVAWSPRAVGQAEAEVLVRDPVVVTASLPRFLAPGDSSRLLLEVVHADGPAGEMPLTLQTGGIALEESAVPAAITLTEGGTARLSIPLRAEGVGDHDLIVSLTTPDGTWLQKTLRLGVRSNDPPTARTRRFSLAAGQTFTLDDAVFDGLRPGGAQALVSAGPLAQFDAPGLLASLDRYPYGCTEQVTSGAMPLLYLSSLTDALGLGDPRTIRLRLAQAVDKVLARQASGGGFGLWRAEGGDFWLDAYVTDFLSRARLERIAVPDRAFRSAMDNLRNRIAYAPDFDSGGEDIAYALMVLAREGQAAMGDLRYYADQKADALATPLAQAQLGTALALYGDQTRADALFSRAARRVAAATEEPPVWRADYGTPLRDAAGLLTLAVEAGSTAIDSAALARRISTSTRRMSTQEQSWALLAAHAMVRDPGVSGLSVNGEAVAGPFVRRLAAAGLVPMAITNTGAGPTDLTLTTIGVPQGATEADGYGYAIERAYFRMDGTPLSGEIAQGDRLVTVLTVRPAEPTGARLMIDDPLPAGFEIDNPNLLRAGDVRSLDWLSPVEAEHAEFRAERFLAAVDWRGDAPFRLAYVIRAVSPGSFHHPAALVEDMYRPQYRATTASGRVTVLP